MRPALGELLEHRNPDFNAFRDRQALRQARNDHLRAEIGRDLGELIVLCEENQGFRGQPPAQRVVADAALAERNDVFDVLARVPEPAIEGEREVLVEQELYAALTAGG